MLDNTLIEKALALTDTEMRKMENTHNEYRFFFEPRFFFAYLLSPKFIEKYTPIYNKNEEENFEERTNAFSLGVAIYQYQSGNEVPLVELLKKI